MKQLLFDQPMLERTSREGLNLQRLYKFPNGWGASIVRNKMPADMIHSDFRPYYSYTNNEDEWELAVIKFSGEGEDDWEIHYKNPVAEGDVRGYLTKEEVETCLKRIHRFRKRNN